MPRHCAAVFSDLERHSLVWTETSRENAVAIIAEYRYLAERLAGQFGAFHQNFTGDGHLFLFEDTDAALQFGIDLIAAWQQCHEKNHALRDTPQIALRLGGHYGECFPLDDDWIGRGIALAKRVESAAAPDSLYVTENLLELADIRRVSFDQAGEHELKGDFLPKRTLYRILLMRERATTSEDAPETAEALFLRAARLDGDADEEERLLRRALELRSDYPEAHNNLAIALRKKGNMEDAAEHYREALRLRPDYPEAHYNYAYLLENLGRLDGAQHHAEEALRLRPSYVDAHHRLANLLAGRGAFEEAAEHYEQALDHRPTYAEVHNNYAILHEHCGRIDLAESHYKQAIRLKRDYPHALYNYGILLEEKGSPEQAESVYREALEVWPDYPEAHNNLAILLHQTDRLSDAEAHYRAALQLRPNDPEAHHNLALLLRKFGADSEADEHFALAKELRPSQDQFRTSIEGPD